MSTNLSLVHFIVGAGSPTELQGRRTSFFQGVVTVPPKDRILAGTAHGKHKVRNLGRTKDEQYAEIKQKLPQHLSHKMSFFVLSDV